jgi:hypothetical protein
MMKATAMRMMVMMTITTSDSAERMYRDGTAKS